MTKSSDISAFKKIENNDKIVKYCIGYNKKIAKKSEKLKD